jgi:DNA (cytosine-5)-methyltransferase 1
MRYLSICSGIEAASAAWMPLGWQPVAFSEIEPFPCAVLAHHHPDVPNLGDMSLFRDWPDELFADADAIVGGPPCQAFSVAGARRGLLDARGNLTLIYVELLDHADDIRRKYGKPPIVALYENVPGIFSDRTNAFGCLVGGLAGEDVPVVPPGKRWTDAGCVFGPERAVAWRLFDAQFFGLAQRRRRVFVVASARKGFDPAQVLFEWDGVRRDTAPSREARQTAPTIPSRSTAGGGLGTDFDCDGGLQVAGTMKACKDSGGWSNSADHAAAGYMIPVETLCVATGQAGAEIGADMAPTLNCNHEAPYVARSLRGEGFDASEGGTGRGTPLVPMFLHANKGRPAGRQSAHTEMVSVKPIVETLTTDGHAQSAVAVPVAYGIRTANTSSNGWGIQEECTHTLDCAQGVAVAFSAKDYGGDAGSIAPTLRAMGHGDSHANGGGQVAVAFAIQAGALRTNPASGPDGVGVQADHAYTLEARAEVQAVQSAMQVRRLTPTECEKLQGFEPGYTAIPWRGKPASECPDGPRYKSLGNSWAVPVARWIGERIEAVEAILDAQPNQQKRRAP